MRPLTWMLAAALAALLFFSWFISNHERVERSQWIPFSGEAAYNEFFAAELLLQELGIAADGHAEIIPSQWLPETDATIVMRLSGVFTSPETSEPMLDWVAQGGHLVLLPGSGYEQFEVFFDYVDMHVVRIDVADEAVEDDPAREAPTGDSLGGSTSGDSVALLQNNQGTDDSSDQETATGSDATGQSDAESGADSSEESELHAYSPPYVWRIESGALLESVSDEHGIIVAQQTWGDGRITLTTDGTGFDNYSLGETPESAQRMLGILTGQFLPQKVWFVLGSEFPSLAELLWEHASWLVVSAALLLLLTLWHYLQRFGPARNEVQPARRSLLEHIAAAGDFALANRGGRDLLQGTIAALLHAAERHHPGISRLAADKQATQLAHITTADAQAILDAFDTRYELSPREFAQRVQFLQNLRTKL